MANPTSIRTVVICLSLALVATGLPGCRRAARARVEIPGLTGSYTAPLGVHVENGLGETSVEVRPKLKAPQVQVFAINRTTGMLRPRGRSEEAWVAAEVVMVEDRPTLRVLSVNPEGGEERAMYIKVRVPAARGVYVRNSGGDVRVIGAGGPIEVQADAARSGKPWRGGSSITVEVDELVDSRVSLSSGDGTVRLTMPGSSRGRLDVQAPERSLELDGGGTVVTDAKSKGEISSATLNGGTNPITLSSRTGKVVVRTREELRPHRP